LGVRVFSGGFFNPPVVFPPGLGRAFFSILDPFFSLLLFRGKMVRPVSVFFSGFSFLPRAALPRFHKPFLLSRSDKGLGLPQPLVLALSVCEKGVGPCMKRLDDKQVSEFLAFLFPAPSLWGVSPPPPNTAFSPPPMARVSFFCSLRTYLSLPPPPPLPPVVCFLVLERGCGPVFLFAIFSVGRQAGFFFSVHSHGL